MPILEIRGMLISAVGSPADGEVLTYDNAADQWRPKPTGGGKIFQVGVAEIPLAPSDAGNFSVEHHLGFTPSMVTIEMESGGDIWFQTSRYDSTYLKLVASSAGVVGRAQCWLSFSGQEVALAPSDAGNFIVPHTLGSVPALVQVQMTSGGSIWQQDPVADASDLYLTASAEGITGYAQVWSIIPAPLIVVRSRVSLAPADAGNFSVAHCLGRNPTLAVIRMTSGGAIWFQSPTRFDGTDLFLTASAGGITGYCEVWG
jgi:hypothetical protein